MEADVRRGVKVNGSDDVLGALDAVPLALVWRDFTVCRIPVQKLHREPDGLALVMDFFLLRTYGVAAEQERWCYAEDSKGSH